MFSGDEIGIIIQQLIDKADKKIAVRFAITCAEHVLPIFIKDFPQDSCAKLAIDAAKLYIDDKIVVSEARKAAFNAHSAARLAPKGSAARSACRAVGHAAATAHCKEHAVACSTYAAKAKEITEGKEGFNNERMWQLAILKDIIKQNL